MADTVRTISYLLSNEFQNGQGGGSITPQVMRDLIVSLQLAGQAGFLVQTNDPTASGLNIGDAYLNGDFLCIRTV